MLILRESYKSQLSLRETVRAIKLIKDTFERNLSKALNLERVSAPLFVDKSSGLNDDLSGIERAVTFDVKNIPGCEAVIVHSLAKWKRMALSEYDFSCGEGLYTDMNAIRRDDELDNTHSIYVDQWDWEKIIKREERTLEYLEETVKKIVGVFISTLDKVKSEFPKVDTKLCSDVYFISAEELLQMYPALPAKEREREITKKYKTVFLTKIGGNLSNGTRHDGRAPDYDDWSLNGDLLFYNEILEDAFEVSSMGIRVDEKSMDEQLKFTGHNERRNYEYHKNILEGKLPLTIGGGIGQSRVCMLLLDKLHIGEVQSSLWSDEMRQKCKENGIFLL